ncbi:MAG: dihydrolipoyl dehydrogenase [Chloroflexi bacterium]|nr:dihydrolipoyl dehydrogenase [Chloroflexota bacterium]
MDRFDVIVIGSGSGLEVSSEAAERGLSVAVVEEGPFGGTCLNRGCIPSKMLIHSADIMETIKTAGQFGIHEKVERIDWQSIIRRVADEIDGDARAVEEGNQKAPNITVFKGRGRFVADKTLEVNGQRLTAETVLIAAGTRPRVPEIRGLSDVPYVTSDEALRLPEQPERLAIVGGGYIAAELGHFFGSLGTEVTLIQRGQLLVQQEDRDVSRRFTEISKRKFRVLLDTQISQVYLNTDEVAIEVSTSGNTETITSDLLLIATGRVPNSDLTEVGRTGVEVDQRGFVKVDEFLETGVPGIWALGDIVGKNLLKHSANLEAAYVAHNMFNPDSKVAVNYHAVPHAIFASPQVAGVGLTEQAATELGVPYVAATYNYYDTAFGSAIEDRDGFVKVLAHRETQEILGCHIMGTDAATLVQEATNAMRMGHSTDAITQSVYVHPALPEVVQRAFGALQF